MVVGASVIGADDAMGGAQRHAHFVRGTEESMDVGDTGGSVSLTVGAYRRVDRGVDGIASSVFFGSCRFGSSTIGRRRGDGTQWISWSKVKLSFGIFFGCSRRSMTRCTCTCSVTARTCRILVSGRTGNAAVGIYGESLHLIGFDPAAVVAGGIVRGGLHLLMQNFKYDAFSFYCLFAFV